MRRIMPGPNMTIFLLFFGLAMIDAIRLHAWIRVAFWLAIASLFLLVDLGHTRAPGDSA